MSPLLQAELVVVAVNSSGDDEDSSNDEDDDDQSFQTADEGETPDDRNDFQEGKHRKLNEDGEKQATSSTKNIEQDTGNAETDGTNVVSTSDAAASDGSQV